MQDINTLSAAQAAELVFAPCTGPVAIVTHIHSDGDGLPSACALAMLMQKAGFDCRVVMAEPIPSLMEFLQLQRFIEPLDKSRVFARLIVVDTNDVGRIGDCAELIPAAGEVLVLDHHQPGDLIPRGRFYINPQKVCLGQVVHEFFRERAEVLPADDRAFYVNCIYTSLLNDTDNFTNANTDKSAYDLAADLCSWGLQPNPVSFYYLYNRPACELRLIGRIMTTLQTHDEGIFAFTHCPLSFLQEEGLTDEATTKLTRWVKGVAGVKVLVFFREVGPDEWRLSLRSTCMDVQAIAARYGGGGHRLASGCPMHGTLAEVQEMMLSDLRQAKCITSS